MKLTKKAVYKLSVLKEKFSRSRGKGNLQSDAQIFNHPRRDKAVRSGRKS